MLSPKYVLWKKNAYPLKHFFFPFFVIDILMWCDDLQTLICIFKSKLLMKDKSKNLFLEKKKFNSTYNNSCEWQIRRMWIAYAPLIAFSTLAMSQILYKWKLNSIWFGFELHLFSYYVTMCFGASFWLSSNFHESLCVRVLYNIDDDDYEQKIHKINNPFDLEHVCCMCTYFNDDGIIRVFHHKNI